MNERWEKRWYEDPEPGEANASGYEVWIVGSNDNAGAVASCMSEEFADRIVGDHNDILDLLETRRDD
jgi:hypothetical protein